MLLGRWVEVSLGLHRYSWESLQSNNWGLLSALYQHLETCSTRLLPFPNKLIDDPSILYNITNVLTDLD